MTKIKPCLFLNGIIVLMKQMLSKSRVTKLYVGKYFQEWTTAGLIDRLLTLQECTSSKEVGVTFLI